MLKKLSYIKEFPLSFYIILSSILINSIGGFVIPFLAIYLTSVKKFPMEHTGIVAGAVGLGTLIAGPFGGYLADIFNKRTILIFSTLMSAFFLSLFLLDLNFHALVIIGFLTGMFNNLCRPAVNSLVIDIVRDDQLENAFRMIYWVNNIGFAISSSLAGIFAEKNFNLLFIADSITTFLFAVIIIIFLPKGITTTEKKDAKTKHHDYFLAPYKHRQFLALFLLSFFLNVIYLQVSSTFAIDMLDHGYSAKTFGYLASMNGILIIVFQPLFSVILNRFRPQTNLATAAVLIAVGYLLMCIHINLFIYIVTITLWSFSEIYISGYNSSLTAKIAPKDKKASFQGAIQFSYGGATFIAPVIGTFIMGKTSANTLWIVCTIGSLLIGYFYYNLKVEATS